MPNWPDAACRGHDPNLFLEPLATWNKERADEHLARARTFCDQCSILQECRQFAISKLPSTDRGIWAGMLPSEIRAERKRRRSAATSVAA